MLERLMNIDRRIIFILVALAVIIPTFLKVSFPITVSDPTRQIYNYIEDLPPKSTVLIAFNYGPSSLAELEPMAAAVLRHCFKKELRVIGNDSFCRRSNVGRRSYQGHRGRNRCRKWQ